MEVLVEAPDAGSVPGHARIERLLVVRRGHWEREEQRRDHQEHVRRERAIESRYDTARRASVGAVLAADFGASTPHLAPRRAPRRAPRSETRRRCRPRFSPRMRRAVLACEVLLAGVHACQRRQRPRRGYNNDDLCSASGGQDSNLRPPVPNQVRHQPAPLPDGAAGEAYQPKYASVMSR